MDNEFLILLQAGLDEAASEGLINDDIKNKLQGKINQLQLTAVIDDDSISAIKGQLEKILKHPITISNINIDTRQAAKNAQQAGQNIGKQIQNGINSIVQKGDFKTEFTFSSGKQNSIVQDTVIKEFKEISNGIVTVKEQMKQVGKESLLDGFIVNIKKANGEVESLTYRLKDMLDTQGKATGEKSFQYVGGFINDNGVLKQLDAISSKADNLQTKLDKLKAGYSDINSSRPIKNSNNISALSQQYDKVTKAIENVRNANNTTFSSMVSNAQREITALESMVAQFRNAENVATQMKSVDISSGITQAKERLGKLKADSTGFEQMTQTLRELDAAITNVGDKSSLDAFIDKLRIAGTQLSRVKAETKSMAQVNKIQLSIDTGGYEAKVEGLISKTRQWADEFGNSRINTDALSKALKNLGDASTILSNNNTVENQRALINAEKELDTQIQKTTNSIRTMNSETMKSSAVDSLRQKYQEFYDKNGAAHRQWGTQLKQAMLELASGAKISKQRGEELRQELVQIQNAARQAGKLGKSGLQKLFEGFKSFSYWTSSTFLVMKAIQEVRKSVTSVKELDTALVDLKKTTTMTAEELEEFYYASNDVAKQMGVSTEEIISQASAFSRLGWSSADAATKMAKLSSQFASISPGMSVDEATTNLTSIIKAYDIEVDDILDGVLSKINQVGNTFGTSNVEIAEGLRLSSAVMASLGGTFEENIALFTAGQEILQDASQMGNAIRSITMRIKGYDEDTQEFSKDVVEATGKVADLTKVASNNNMGISMFTDTSQTHYKSLVEYLGQISDIWDEIDEKSQVSLLQNLFGKNRA